GDRGKLELDTDRWTLKLMRNAVPAFEFSRTTTELFARPATEEVPIPAETGAESHIVILENFRDAILDGVPLVAPAEEGIPSLEIGNAMLLSGLLGTPVELPLDAGLMVRELSRLRSR